MLNTGVEQNPNYPFFSEEPTSATTSATSSRMSCCATVAVKSPSIASHSKTCHSGKNSAAFHQLNHDQSVATTRSRSAIFLDMFGDMGKSKNFICVSF